MNTYRNTLKGVYETEGNTFFTVMYTYSLSCDTVVTKYNMFTRELASLSDLLHDGPSCNPWASSSYISSYWSWKSCCQCFLWSPPKYLLDTAIDRRLENRFVVWQFNVIFTAPRWGKIATRGLGLIMQQKQLFGVQ